VLAVIYACPDMLHSSTRVDFLDRLLLASAVSAIEALCKLLVSSFPT
jgi:hypothetical protein